MQSLIAPSDITIIDDEERMRHCEISELRRKIFFLKNTMYISNAFLLTFAIITIALYFTTKLFDRVKLQDKRKYCAHAKVQLHAFEECSKGCSANHLCCLDKSCSRANGNGTDSDERVIDCELYSDCEPLYHLLSPEWNVELEDTCAQGLISSSNEGMMECGEKCKIAECCWKENPDENCYNKSATLCSVFLPCSIDIDPLTFGALDQIQGHNRTR